MNAFHLWKIRGGMLYREGVSIHVAVLDVEQHNWTPGGAAVVVTLASQRLRRKGGNRVRSWGATFSHMDVVEKFP